MTRVFHDCKPQKIGKSDGAVIAVTVLSFNTANDGAMVQLVDAAGGVHETWKKGEEGNTWKGEWVDNVYLHYHGDGTDRSKIEWEMH